jgi:hypothetical protein
MNRRHAFGSRSLWGKKRNEGSSGSTHVALPKAERQHSRQLQKQHPDNAKTVVLLMDEERLAVASLATQCLAGGTAYRYAGAAAPALSC